MLVEAGLVESKSIRGSRWRFRDPEVGAIHDRYESWLRSHVLEVERRLHEAQRPLAGRLERLARPLARRSG